MTSARPGEGTSGDSLFTPAFIVLTLGELAYFTAFGIMIPVTPLFARGPLGADELGVGLAIGVFSLAALLLRPWAGRVSDRRGRRPLLLGGAVLFTVVAAGHLLASDLLVLTALRCLLGVAEACFFVAGVAALADLAPPGRAGEAVSYNSLALYLGIAFGPLIGEALVDIGGFDLAWTGSALLGAVTVLVVWRIPETASSASSSGRETDAPGRPALLHPGAIGPGLALCAGVTAMAGFLAFVALHARDIGLDGARYVLLEFGLTVVAMRILFARLPDRMSVLRLGAISLGFTAAGLLVAGLTAERVGLFLGAFLSAAGVAFLTPAIFAFIFARVRAGERGAAIGTASLFLDLGFGGGPLLFGAVAVVAGIPAAFIAGAIVALTGALATAVAERRSRPGFSRLRAP